MYLYDDVEYHLNYDGKQAGTMYFSDWLSDDLKLPIVDHLKLPQVQ